MISVLTGQAVCLVCLWDNGLDAVECTILGRRHCKRVLSESSICDLKLWRRMMFVVGHRLALCSLGVGTYVVTVRHTSWAKVSASSNKTGPGEPCLAVCRWLSY